MNTTMNEEEKQVEVEDGRKWHFTIIENKVFEDERLSGQELLVYWTLCYHADRHDGKCFPSIQRIRKEARCSKRAVVNSLNHLIELEYIKKEKRKSPDGKQFLNNRYTILDLGGVVHERPKGSAFGTQGVVHEGASNKSHLKQESNNNKETVVALFQDVFKEKIPSSLLGNPHLERCVKYMVELAGRDDIEKPLAYLRSLLKTPNEVPEMQEDQEEKEEEAVYDLERLRDRIVENRNDSLEIAEQYRRCRRAIRLGFWDEVGRIKAEMAKAIHRGAGCLVRRDPAEIEA